jgi:hypothetical protein
MASLPPTIRARRSRGSSRSRFLRAFNPPYRLVVEVNPASVSRNKSRCCFSDEVGGKRDIPTSCLRPPNDNQGRSCTRWAVSVIKKDYELILLCLEFKSSGRVSSRCRVRPHLRAQCCSFLYDVHICPYGFFVQSVS